MDLADYIKIRLIILKAAIINTFYIETAYIANGWTNMISTTVFVITQVLFVDVIYSNVKTIAGYSRDEMLLFSIIVQIHFYIIVGIMAQNTKSLIKSINSGSFDLLLTKPLPTLFYSSFMNVNLISTLRDGVPPLLIMILATNFSNLEVNLLNLIIGSLVIVLGLFISHSMQIISALPSFWLGESSNIMSAFFEVEFNLSTTFPFEGWSKAFRLIFITIFPIAITTGLSTSIILGKTGKEIVFLVFTIAIIMHFLKMRLWKWGLKNYTSASS